MQGDLKASDIRGGDDLFRFNERPDDESDHSGFNVLGSFGFAAGPLDAVWGAYPHSEPLWNQFVALDLAPGESFTFDFFTFYPISGSAPDGYLLTNSASLAVVPNDQSRGRVLPDTISREWTIMVDASITSTPHPSYPPSVTAVPDCSSIGLLLGISSALVAALTFGWHGMWRWKECPA